MTFLLRELQLVLGLAAAVAFLTGWFVARFRAGDRIRRSEAQVREMAEIKEGLEAELQEHTAALQGMSDEQVTRELAVQETALEEMRASLSAASDEADAVRRKVDATRAEADALRQERDALTADLELIQSDRRAVQDQLAASRRAHEDLTERYVKLEARLRKMQSQPQPRIDTPPPPSGPTSAETLAAAAAEVVEDVQASPEPATPVQDVAGKREGARLEAMGLRTHLDLVRKCGPRAGREIVSASTGIPQDELRRWTGMADLLRLTGMDRKAALRLHDAGVSSIQDLARADATHLQSDVAPTIATDQLQGWIQAARNLQPMVEA